MNSSKDEEIQPTVKLVNVAFLLTLQDYQLSLPVYNLLPAAARKERRHVLQAAPVVLSSPSRFVDLLRLARMLKQCQSERLRYTMDPKLINPSLLSYLLRD